MPSLGLVTDFGGANITSGMVLIVSKSDCLLLVALALRVILKIDIIYFFRDVH